VRSHSTRNRDWAGRRVRARSKKRLVNMYIPIIFGCFKRRRTQARSLSDKSNGSSSILFPPLSSCQSDFLWDQLMQSVKRWHTSPHKVNVKCPWERATNPFKNIQGPILYLACAKQADTTGLLSSLRPNYCLSLSS